jgi:multiple sugar transport system ATP-binding protein
MTVVRLESLTKRFGSVAAVDSIDLSIASGEFIVLVGPSGSGKTTSLRMVAGLETVTSGCIFIGDTDVANVHAKDRNVAMVFQSYALYPHMTVAQNMGFALKLRKVPKDEIDRRVTEVASMLGLTTELPRKPKTLSGGQQQRVALGRAIVRDPAVFLFDEPLSNLDAKLRLAMRGELIKLHHRLDTTMIYVTHDQIEAMTMGDRIVVMHEGNIRQVGTPLNVYDDPDDVFVAEFIGSPTMNIVHGVTKLGDSGPSFSAGGLNFALTPVHAAARDGAVTIGIRPEFISFEETGDTVSIDCNIEVVEHLGADTILELATAGQTLTAKIARNDSVNFGDSVRMWVDPARILAFEPDTGKRIRV